MLRTFVLLFALMLLVPATSFAQTVTPSETQLRYNNEGVLKMQDNDYEGAVARFQSSLAVGELNITYLNLGRSFFRLERCLEAREAFDAVENSPQVASPTPAEVKTALGNFRKDLEELCTAEVVFVCAEPSRVGIDNSKPRVCEGELAWPVAPGKHDAIRHDIDVTESVTVSSGASEKVELVAAPEPKEDPIDGSGDTPPQVEAPSTPVDKPMATKDIFGWFALGSGAVLLGTALIVDLAVIGPSLDRANSAEGTERDDAISDLESQQSLNRIVIGSGIGLAVVGAALLLWPDAEDSSTVQWSPTVGPDSVGASATLRW